jgi:hypothetical protein
MVTGPLTSALTASANPKRSSTGSTPLVAVVSSERSNEVTYDHEASGSKPSTASPSGGWASSQAGVSPGGALKTRPATPL